MASLKVKKKVSKKNKSSWRKYVNIKDVEDFLENQRQDERIGSLSDKTDGEIFTIDNIVQNKKVFSSKQRKKFNALKPPRNTGILENFSKVQDPVAQRNRVRQKKNGRNLIDEVVSPDSIKKIKANTDRAKYYERLDKKLSKKKEDKQFYDKWEENDTPEKNNFLNNEWISRELGLYHLRNTGKPLVKTHASAHHKTSKAKAIGVPDPGISYNPSLKDHQNLLAKVIDRECKIIKKEKHLKRVTTDMFRKITENERDKDLLVEMCAENPDVGKETNLEHCIESNENESTDTIVYDSINPPVENKKKDKKTRRKQKEQREILKRVQKKKNDKKIATDIHRLKYLKEEVLTEIEEIKKAKKRRAVLNEKNKYCPKRISKVKFEEPEISINMAEDISGNLRNLQPDCSLLIARFQDFQKRNIIAPGIDVGPHKRKKIKRFVRKSHKDVENVSISVKK